MENPLVSRSSPVISASFPLSSYTFETLRTDRMSYVDPRVGILASGAGMAARRCRGMVEEKEKVEEGFTPEDEEKRGGGIRGEWTTPCYQLGASRLPKPTNYYIPTIAILVPNQAPYRTPVSLRVLCSQLKDSLP